MFIEPARGACVRRGEADKGTFASPWDYLVAGTVSRRCRALCVSRAFMSALGHQDDERFPEPCECQSSPKSAKKASGERSRSREGGHQEEDVMNGLIYLVGLIVVIMAILSLFGLR